MVKTREDLEHCQKDFVEERAQFFAQLAWSELSEVDCWILGKSHSNLFEIH